MRKVEEIAVDCKTMAVRLREDSQGYTPIVNATNTLAAAMELLAEVFEKFMDDEEEL
jgi:hypothetical protein